MWKRKIYKNREKIRKLYHKKVGIILEDVICESRVQKGMGEREMEFFSNYRV